MARPPIEPAATDPGPALSPDARQVRQAERVARLAQLAQARKAADFAAGLFEAMGRISSSVGYRAAVVDRTRRARGRSGGSADYQNDRYTRAELVEQAQDLDRNSALARAAATRKVDLLLGAGVKPVPSSGDEAWNDRAEDVWERFSAECDRCGVHAFEDLQRLARRACFVEGDCGFILLQDGTLQAVESQRIVSPAGAADGVPRDGVSFHDGVERRGGRIVAYHVADWEATGSGVRTVTRRIRAEDFVFVFRPDRFGQSRGVPELAASIRTIEQVDTFIEATTISAMVAAMVAFYHKSRSPQGARRMFGEDTESVATSGGGQRSRNLADLAPGQMIFAGADDDLGTLASDKPGPQFNPFVQVLTRIAMAPTGVPLELALLDFTGGNFAMARALVMLVQAQMRSERRAFVRQFCEPVYRWAIGRAIVRGELAPVEGWRRVRWTDPPLPWFDPAKEAQANDVALRTNQKSLTQILGETGRTLQGHLAEIAREQQLQRELGILPAPMPGQEAKGANAAEDDGQPAPRRRRGPAPDAPDSPDDPGEGGDPEAALSAALARMRSALEGLERSAGSAGEGGGAP